MRHKILGALLVGAISVTPAISQNSNDGKSRKLIVYNQGNIQIITFNGAPTRTNSWGPDLMPGTGKIRPGRARMFNLDDGQGSCLYNLRAMFADGTVVSMQNADICGAIAAGDGWVTSNQ